MTDISELDLNDDAQLGQLLRKLSEDKRTRRPVVKALKELRPDLRFPDVDVEDIREEMTTRFSEDKAEREADKIRARMEANRAKLKDRYDDETIVKIEKDVMEKHGISDYDLAAKIYAADQPPPVEKRNPEHRHGARFELPDMGDYFKDPKKAALDEAYAAIDELRGARR